MVRGGGLEARPPALDHAVDLLAPLEAPRPHLDPIPVVEHARPAVLWQRGPLRAGKAIGVDVCFAEDLLGLEPVVQRAVRPSGEDQRPDLILDELVVALPHGGGHVVIYNAVETFRYGGQNERPSGRLIASNLQRVSILMIPNGCCALCTLVRASMRVYARSRMADLLQRPD